MSLVALTGYHCTQKHTYKKIRSGGLKGSKWTENLEELVAMNSNPWELHADGAVWCYPSLELAQENLDDGEVILEVSGQGIVVEHEAHGTCFVLRANLSTKKLVK